MSDQDSPTSMEISEAQKHNNEDINDSNAENSSNEKCFKYSYTCMIVVLIGIVLCLMGNFYNKNKKSFNPILKANLKNHYDILLVGAGLFNAVLAEHFIRAGKTVLVVERRNHIAGNCYSENRENIDVHIYGPHIFHTDDEEVWKYVNKFAEFKQFTLQVVAHNKGKLYNLPFNMHTFYQLYGTITPEEAEKKIKEEAEAAGIGEPKNLEEQAIKQVGKKIYETLIKEYTEKQWERPCNTLPSSIIKRLPVRYKYDNNYFNDKYQGIPLNGYTEWINNMYKGSDIVLNTDYLKNKEEWNSLADQVFFSGLIDEYYDFSLGALEYRSLRFEIKTLDKVNYQGSPMVNYPDKNFPYTRITEHKHFNDKGSNKTIISEEYSSEWKKGDIPYYPINNEKNMALYKKYKEINNEKVIFVGRLGMYKYFDMDDTIIEAFKLLKELGYRKNNEKKGKNKNHFL